MMASNTRTLLISTALIIVGLVAVVGLTHYLEQHRQNLPETYFDEDLDVQGKKLKGFALGGEGLLADVYWMRALQYVGDKVINAKSHTFNIENLRPLNPRLLYPLLDSATDLDPKFTTAFSYGATVLPAIDLDEAVALTEKGIALNPNEWRFYQYLGYIYWRSENYEKAAAVYERGSQIPGAPPFMKLMAGRMRSDGGARGTAREIYSQMLDQDIDEQSRDIARQRLTEIDTLEEMDAVNAALEAFKTDNGRCVADLSEILPQLKRLTYQTNRQFRIDAAGRLTNPSGAPYRLDPRNCSVATDNKTAPGPVE
jgi:tetratricopeptide (TPR) repeat protein